MQYYGPEFPGVYKPLLDVDRDDTPYVDYFKRGEFTTLHWNINFVGKYASHDGGRLSANDQAYLRWMCESHGAVPVVRLVLADLQVDPSDPGIEALQQLSSPIIRNEKTDIE